ncbi:MAG: exosortase/archaeosortase family protein [Candidatus Diapherotrites archaeon]|nr:exosortase/archaeosortase family protein [Candidatus Diapherotrites archaeon]
MVDLRLEKKDKFLLNVLSFLVVMAFFGAVVFFISNSQLDIPQVRELVSVHSTLLLNMVGYPSTFEDKNLIVEFEKKDFSNGAVSKVIALSASEDPLIQKNGDVFIAVLAYTDESRAAIVNALEESDVKWGEEGPTIVMEFRDSNENQAVFRSSIVRECVGYISILAVIGLIVGYPFAGFRKKLFGLLIGVPLIYFANVVRITTIMMGVHDIGYWVFDLFHIFIWREGMILVSLGIWFFWTRMPDNGETNIE